MLLLSSTQAALGNSVHQQVYALQAIGSTSCGVYKQYSREGEQPAGRESPWRFCMTLHEHGRRPALLK